MRILSIGKETLHDKLVIVSIKKLDKTTIESILFYDYIIIHGGDGAIRRVIKELQYIEGLPPFILNPTGSFNVIAKLHNVDKLEKVLKTLSQDIKPTTEIQKAYRLNSEVFLFSAGNMGDLQHIFLAETLRFGILKNGILKYILSLFILMPIHIIITPFMLLSKERFFIFTPLSFIKKLGSFYGKVGTINIDLKNSYNFIELDGDIVLIEDSKLEIEPISSINIVI